MANIATHKFDKDSEAYKFFSANFIHDPRDPTLKRTADAALVKAMEAVQSKMTYSVGLANHYEGFINLQRSLEKEVGRKLSPIEVLVEMVQRVAAMLDCEISPEIQAELADLSQATGKPKKQLLAEALSLLKDKLLAPPVQQQPQEQKVSRAGRPPGKALDNLKEVTAQIIQHNWNVPLSRRIEINHGVLDKGIDERYWQHYGIQLKGTRSRKVEEFLKSPQIEKLLDLHHKHMGITGKHNAEIQRRLRFNQEFEDIDNEQPQVYYDQTEQEEVLLKQLGMI